MNKNKHNVDEKGLNSHCGPISIFHSYDIAQRTIKLLNTGDENNVVSYRVEIFTVIVAQQSNTLSHPFSELDFSDNT